MPNKGGYMNFSVCYGIFEQPQERQPARPHLTSPLVRRRSSWRKSKNQVGEYFIMTRKRTTKPGEKIWILMKSGRTSVFEVHTIREKWHNIILKDKRQEFQGGRSASPML